MKKRDFKPQTLAHLGSLSRVFPLPVILKYSSTLLSYSSMILSLNLGGIPNLNRLLSARAGPSTIVSEGARSLISVRHKTTTSYGNMCG